MRSRAAPLLVACLAALLLSPLPASAQRRVIGGSTTEETPTEAPPEEAPAEDDEAAQKKAAEKAKREAEAKKKAEEEARREAEEEKKRLAEEAARRKEEEARKKEEARLEAIRDGRLKTAKTRRRLTREDGKLRGTIALLPGAAKASQLLEVRVDVAERLKIADPRFGELKPLQGLRLIATVREPSTGGGSPVEHRYVVHGLRAPGAYGFHHTPRMDGEHTVRIDGQTAKGEPFSFEFPLHVGAWPPPDFDEEEKNNARFEASGGGRRRAVGAR